VQAVLNGGLVTFVPVKVNLNLKTETVEELMEKKKRSHLVVALAMVEQLRYELGEWAVNAEAAARLQRDTSRNPDGTFSAATLADYVIEQCNYVVKRHDEVTVKEYVDATVFRALVSEMMETQAWAKEKQRLWMQDASQPICFLQGFSLRQCHRMWQSFQRKRMEVACAVSCDRKSASLELLKSRGLVGLMQQGLRRDSNADKEDVMAQVNADGEGVMIQAGGDGWTATDIFAAAAAGADVDATDPCGGNCIMEAARYGYVESLVALIEVKGNVNNRDSNGWTPICIAAQNGHSACISLLLSAKGDVNQCNNNGRSPVFIAAQNGNPDCISLLLTAKGDVNKCNNMGGSPIYIAAQYGHPACITRLLLAGADTHCILNGVSALDIARQKGHAECERLLEAALT
jgi:hypothetical protein